MAASQILQHLEDSHRFDLDHTRERMVDRYDDEKSGEDQQRQSTRHHRLRTKIVGPEKKRKSNRQDGASKEYQPNDLGHDAGRLDEPCATRLGDDAELAQYFRQNR